MKEVINGIFSVYFIVACLVFVVELDERRDNTASALAAGAFWPAYLAQRMP